VILCFGDEFTVALQGLPDILEREAKEFFTHHVRDEGGSAALVRISVAQQPLPEWSAAIPDLDEPSLRAWARGGELLFALDGIGCLCRPASGVAQLLVQDLEAIPLAQFAGWFLVSVLFALAPPRGWIGLHAAAVEMNGRAVVLPGPSGCGKSTLFAAAAQQGHGVLSDDLVWLCQAGDGYHAVAFPRGGAVAQQVPPSCTDLPLGAFVLPSITTRGPSTIETISRAAAVQELMRQGALLPASPVAAEQFRLMAEAAGFVGCYRLVAGPEHDAVAVIAAALAPSGERGP